MLLIREVTKKKLKNFENKFSKRSKMENRITY